MNSIITYKHLAVICLIPLFFSFGCSSLNKAGNISENSDNAKANLKRKLIAGEIHHYSISLSTGDFLHIKAEQFGIDLIAKVSTLDSQFAEQFDSPNGELNAENIFILSDSNRKYDIQIYPAQKYADPGEYVIKLMRSGKASERDKKWIAALTATQKADKMRAKSETREQSIQQYEVAMTEWLALKDNLQYARAMRSMGFVYIRLKNYDKAVEIFTQLLPLWNQLGETRAEGFTQLIIGRIYDLQKDYKKSLEYNLKSLPYWIKGNDSDQESFTLMNIGNLYSYLGDKQKAVEYYEQALKKNELSERPSVKSVIQRDYANSLMRLGEEENAIQLYEKSLKQWQATANKPEEARTAVLLAAHFGKNNDQQKAKLYYRHALEIWKKLDEKNEIKNIQTALEKLEKLSIEH
jgi:tetratricopeptide (TPR) repeat protein